MRCVFIPKLFSEKLSQKNFQLKISLVKLSTWKHFFSCTIEKKNFQLENFNGFVQFANFALYTNSFVLLVNKHLQCTEFIRTLPNLGEIVNHPKRLNFVRFFSSKITWLSETMSPPPQREPKHQCPVCRKMFTTSASRDTHVAVIHEVSLLRNQQEFFRWRPSSIRFTSSSPHIYCPWPHCNVSIRCVYSPNPLVSPQNSGRFRCAFCIKTFGFRKGLEEHERTHTVRFIQWTSYCEHTMNFIRQCSIYFDDLTTICLSSKRISSLSPHPGRKAIPLQTLFEPIHYQRWLQEPLPRLPCGAYRPVSVRQPFVRLQ